MSKRLVLLVAVIGSGLACTQEPGESVVCGDGTLLDPEGTTCIADRSEVITCGVGTHLVDRTCVPNGEVRFELRVFDPMISADGLTRIPVLALGTNEDGTPSTEPVVLGVSRPGAGAFTQTSIELGELGTVAYFRPCSSSQVGCLGPVTLTLTRVAEPTMPAATVDVQLIDRIGGSAVASCLTGGNVIYVEGQDNIYTGVYAGNDASWGVQGKKKRVTFRIDPSNPQLGKWKIDLSTERRTDDLAPGIYDMAQKVDQESPGRPGLDISRQGRQCQAVDGRFEVHEYTVSDEDVVERATISFEQRCAGEPTGLRGCLRYVR